jgi:hypothetical protein
MPYRTMTESELMASASIYKDPLEEALNIMASDGWELRGVVNRRDETKKPKRFNVFIFYKKR